MSTTAQDFVVALGPDAKARKNGNGWQARCPAHDDNTPSLSITDGDNGRVLLKCFAGCTFDAICNAASIPPRDLFPADLKPRRKSRQKEIVATYPYHDETGELLYEAVRFEPKDFRQRRPNPQKSGEWIWNLDGIQTVLFRLPETLKAIKQGKPVLIVEGEKDALALVKHGFAATCNPMGAGKWREQYTTSLTGADCIVIPDNDEPGRNHATQVCESLNGKASRVRLLKLSDELNGRPVKDAADFFNAGGTIADLIGIIDAAPEWSPVESSVVTIAAQSATEVETWIRGVIVEALTDSRAKSWEQRQRISAAVVEALAKIGQFYFNSEQPDFSSALYFNGQTKRLERIASDAFAAWLSEFIKVNRGEGLYRNIFTEVQNAALTGQHANGITPEAYWAAREGTIYLSCGDGRMAKVSASGVQLVDNGTDGVLFPVGKTLEAWQLVEPADPFESCSLFRNVHSIAQHGKTLLKLWAYSLATNPRSKPPIALCGDIGSGKTRTAKGIAELFGLPFIAAKVEEGNEDDFWPGMDAGGLFTLDNADTKCRWLADALANAATDGCSQRRKKYTDSDRVILRARAWLAVTTANPTFASDAGLADRLLVVRMGRHNGETSDAGLSDEIRNARNAGLSHIAATLAKALADRSPTPAGLNARHPDFAATAVRIGRALGIEHDAIDALTAAEQDKSVFCLENDTVAPVLMAFLTEAGRFEGTAGDLLTFLQHRDQDLRNLTAKGLGKRLSNLLPHLAKVLKVASRTPVRGGFEFRFETSNAGLHV